MPIVFLRTFNFRFLSLLVLGVLIFCLAPLDIFAGGAQEANRLYESEMKSTVDDITVAVESEEMSAAEAKVLLAELRDRFRKELNKIG